MDYGRNSKIWFKNGWCCKQKEGWFLRGWDYEAVDMSTLEEFVMGGLKLLDILNGIILAYLLKTNEK